MFQSKALTCVESKGCRLPLEQIVKVLKKENINQTNYHQVQYRDVIPQQDLPIPPQALGEDIEVPFIS